MENHTLIISPSPLYQCRFEHKKKPVKSPVPQADIEGGEGAGKHLCDLVSCVKFHTDLPQTRGNITVQKLRFLQRNVWHTFQFAVLRTPRNFTFLLNLVWQILFKENWKTEYKTK